MSATPFHPIVDAWFVEKFGAPTDPQTRGWPHILAGRHTLIAAPTGSGKTFAGFLAAIDGLLRDALNGALEDRTTVVYVSPLKALSNDIRRNLEAPLAEIADAAARAGKLVPPLRAMVRTGDTPAAERAAMLRRPPHILVTTPESLYLLLTAEKSRALLGGVRTVIVDEIHALVRDKRGSHLALTLERLEALCEKPPVRVGLSATQRPIEEIARYLVGTRRVASGGKPDCAIVDGGHARALDLAVELPDSELGAVCSNEQWAELDAKLVALIESHRSTLVFVNTRRMAERVARRLSEKLGEDAVASHHGSLSRAIRLDAEERLKAGKLKVIVATASLELGIDVGFIDLVCQLGSPRAIATFLQRVGRAGHRLGVVPKGRLFCLTRDELLEGLALLRAVRGGRLDAVEPPVAPLDILAQQVVAEVAASGERTEDGLFALARGAWPYQGLSRADFDAVIAMSSEGVGRARKDGAYLHRDAVHGVLRPRRAARLTAITSGGAIPETADYRVITEGDETFVGTVNEDFAIESMAGDVFLLGNTSWRVRYIRGGQVVVVDAQGAPATVPFWLGEAPGRTVELSAEVSDLREGLDKRLEDGVAAAEAWLAAESGADPVAARQAVAYAHAQKAALGFLPTRKKVLFERFFDDSGGMQLVVHAPFGSRINRAWGLAMRKKFCRSFDFELQASADDNGIVLSIGVQHSFPLEQMFKLVSSKSAEETLVQALLAAPMFQVRWRWNVTRALAVLRTRGGKKVPPPLQRFRADDLLTAVFPMQTACFEHRPPDLEVPDHPLVRQTVHDCLTEAMDVVRWTALLEEIERGGVELVGRDTREPSPFSHSILNANPYAFLDDAPLEERRARAVALRRTLSPEDARDLASLDPEAVAVVAEEAKPLVRGADELHDALLSLGALPAAEGREWKGWFDELVKAGRAGEWRRDGKPALWAAAERWTALEAACPDGTGHPSPELPSSLRATCSEEDAVAALVRGRLEISAITDGAAIAADLGLSTTAVEAGLARLEAEGLALQGKWTAKTTQWCERRLLNRIHRLTLEGARKRVSAVPPETYWRFLAEYHHLGASARREGRAGLHEAVGQLQGFEMAAASWETDALPSRVAGYQPEWLDTMSFSGELAWGRLRPPRRVEDAPRAGSALTRAAPIALAFREDLPWALPPGRPDAAAAIAAARPEAQKAYAALKREGALFFDDIADAAGLMPEQVKDALRELAALGAVTSDGFAALRGLVLTRPAPARRRGRWGAARPARAGRSGRWTTFPGRVAPAEPGERAKAWAWQLLRRYGVLFRDLLERENAAPSWWELTQALRRLEARGEIRGGRFVSGVAGEQYALPEAVEALRRERKPGEWLVVSASDPLNLAGVLDAGGRVPAVRGNRVLYRDGAVAAVLQAGEVAFRPGFPEAAQPKAARALQLQLPSLRDGVLAELAASLVA